MYYDCGPELALDLTPPRIDSKALANLQTLVDMARALPREQRLLARQESLAQCLHYNFPDGLPLMRTRLSLQGDCALSPSNKIMLALLARSRDPLASLCAAARCLGARSDCGRYERLADGSVRVHAHQKQARAALVHVLTPVHDLRSALQVAALAHFCIWRMHPWSRANALLAVLAAKYVLDRVLPFPFPMRFKGSPEDTARELLERATRHYVQRLDSAGCFER